MRCLTLAQVMREIGINCQFICREHDGNLISQIRQQGFKVEVLPVEDRNLDPNTQKQDNFPYASWLGAEWVKDAHETELVLNKSPVDWIIIDHYAIDILWEQKLRLMCRRILVIDDLANRSHDCDLLLDQNIGRNPADYTSLIPKGCKLVVGPKYALIRPDFLKFRDYSLNRRETPQQFQLLIMMGGVDKDNMTGLILDNLSVETLPLSFKIKIVMGIHSPWINQVRKKSLHLPWPTEVLINIIDMAKLMAESDFAIGAAGTSILERCCLGLPTLTVIQAENQREGAVALKELNACLLIEDVNKIGKYLNKKIADLLNIKKIKHIQQSSANLCDGRGSERLMNMLISYD
jgi:UDP-2,4-diacetamido-2,4,6-trideoxy-beta-L-altropyranose hydrolase